MTATIESPGQSAGVLPLPWVYDDGGRAAAGYKGRTGDCVCRAVAIAGRVPYQGVYDHIIDVGKRERMTKRQGSRSHPRTGVRKRSTRRIMEHYGGVWTPTMHIGSGTTVHVRAGELPTGRIVLSVSRHVVAFIDGTVRDTHDPSRDGDRCVYGFWTFPD